MPRGLIRKLRQRAGRVAGRLARRRAEDSVSASGRYWDQHLPETGGEVRYWLEVEAIARAVNTRITGEPGGFPLPAFLHLAREYTPVERALSIGCGLGELERHLIHMDGAKRVDAIDVGRRSLEEARQSAEQKGYGDRIQYHLRDAASWLRKHRQSRYDFIFFHGSLHHIEALEEVLEACARCLRRGDPGWLFVDEYVGPSRDEWTDEHLRPARRFFARIPENLRRTPKLMPPIAYEDPTEMIRSSEITSMLYRFFEVTYDRPYYGNVLFPLVCGIRGSALEKPEVAAVIEEAIAYEDDLIAAGEVKPFYAAYLARPLPAG